MGSTAIRKHMIETKQSIRCAGNCKVGHHSWLFKFTNRHVCFLQIRTKPENIILQGIIDGTRKPKSLQGYLAPFVHELEMLNTGVPTYDAASKDTFNLRAMLVCSQQDYVGMSDIANQRGAGEHTEHSESNPTCFGTWWVKTSGKDTFMKPADSIIEASKIDHQVFFCEDPCRPGWSHVFAYRGSSYQIPGHHYGPDGRVLDLEHMRPT
jgi:hypothetical protein